MCKFGWKNLETSYGQFNVNLLSAISNTDRNLYSRGPAKDTVLWFEPNVSLTFRVQENEKDEL